MAKKFQGWSWPGGFNIKEGPIDAWTANLTPDKETGIGNWSDEQIINAIRNGKRPDGRTIGPPMPFYFYRGISDRDVKAIAAYLRSIKPVRNKVKASQVCFPITALLRTCGDNCPGGFPGEPREIRGVPGRPAGSLSRVPYANGKG